MKISKRESRFRENIAAISAEFHGDKRYKKFYDKYGESHGGFCGIWGWMVALAESFTKAEDKFLKRSTWDGEYIDTILEFVALVYKVKDHTELNELAQNKLAKTAFDNITVRDVQIQKASGATSFAKVPGEPIKPINPTRYFVLEMDDGESEDGPSMYYIGQGHADWCAIDKGHVLKEATKFPTADAARKEFNKLGCAKHEWVWITQLDSNGYVVNRDVLHTPET